MPPSSKLTEDCFPLLYRRTRTTGIVGLLISFIFYNYISPVAGAFIAGLSLSAFIFLKLWSVAIEPILHEADNIRSAKEITTFSFSNGFNLTLEGHHSTWSKKDTPTKACVIFAVYENQED